MYLTLTCQHGVRNMARTNVTLSPQDIDRLKKEFYSAIQRLEQELGCKIGAYDEQNKFYIVIPVQEFTKALVTKIRQNINKKLLQMFEIQGTAVNQFIVIRLEVKQHG